MSFSHRTGIEASPTPFARAVHEARRRGAPILDLTRTNPTVAKVPYADADIVAAVGRREISTYDPAPLGSSEARTAVARLWSERGFDVDPGRIVLTASTSEAYSYLFTVLADPGDEILSPEPSYPLFEHLARFAGVKLVPYRLEYDGRWHVDLDSLARARTRRTRAVIVVSPNNPTGQLLRRDELAAIAGLGLPVIADEVFASYRLGTDPEHVESALEAQGTLVFALGGLSKQAALPQMKVAWITVGGPDAGAQGALGRLELVADTYLSVSTPAQVALPVLLASRHVAEKAILGRIRRNFEALQRAASSSAVTVLAADAGWSAVLRLPSTRSEEQWVMGLLEDEDVLVQPGWFYDFRTEPFVVVSLLTEEAILDAGMERIVRHVSEHA